MKKLNSIFIDLRNKEHVDWWINKASKLVKVVHYDTIVETATNKPIGIIIMIKGILKPYVIKENNKFISNPTVGVFKR